ncbi:MAG: MotE family protein [Magnetospirillum sp.]|nr:MotE family protein [Magnetospirillum sp.]
MAAVKKTSKKKTSTRPTLRLLPALMGAAALMLSVRIHDIWRGLSGSVRVGTELEAQQPPRGQGPAQVAAATPQAPVAAPASPAPAKPQSGPQPAGPPAGGSDGDSGAGEMTQTEIDVLEKLSARRAQLDAREKDIERREDLLKAAESQIDRKVAEMKSLQSTIEGLLRQYNEQEDNKMRSLVKIYENMKPKDAAKIFEQLDMEILLEVVERMKEQKVAPILAEMDPSKAKNVTAELAQRRQMPLPTPPAGG